MILNLPIAGTSGIYDVVMTGHAGARVSFSRALQNCMEMVPQTGGLFIHTGTNNCAGMAFTNSVPRCSFALEPPTGSRWNK